MADSWYAAVLPVHVGLAHARDLMLTGRRIEAAEAERIGLIARVVPHEELLESAEQIAWQILDTAPVARAQWKRMMNSRYGWVDRPTFEASIRGEECVEGFRALVEKRPPSWVRQR